MRFVPPRPWCSLAATPFAPETAMSTLAQLWMPILVTAILVFLASSLIHMVFKWHNSEYRKLANEDEVMAAVRAGAPTPGQYVMPHCADMKLMRDEAMQRKFRDGPVGLLTLRRNGAPHVGGSLLRWFVFVLAVAAIAGVVAAQAVGLPGNNRAGGHLVGMISLLTYAGGSVQNGIWMGRPWTAVAKDLLDSLIYATISALTFMWLWP
jgi:hypothetical protein